MDIFLRMADQDITYWEPSSRSSSDPYRSKVWSSPVALKGRWEVHQKRMIADQGEEFVSKAKVFLDRTVLVGGFLYLGTSTATDPKPVEGAYEIRMVETIPDVFQRSEFHTAMLG